MEMSRQRLRPGMLEATTQSCPHCHGTGLIRSEDNLALTLLREAEEEAVRGRNKGYRPLSRVCCKLSYEPKARAHCST